MYANLFGLPQGKGFIWSIHSVLLKELCKLRNDATVFISFVVRGFTLSPAGKTSHFKS